MKHREFRFKEFDEQTKRQLALIDCKIEELQKERNNVIKSWFEYNEDKELLKEVQEGEGK
jgi:hypothetical protein